MRTPWPVDAKAKRLLQHRTDAQAPDCGAARVVLCGTCLDARGIAENDLIEGVACSTIDELAGESSVTFEPPLVAGSGGEAFLSRLAGFRASPVGARSAFVHAIVDRRGSVLRLDTHQAYRDLWAHRSPCRSRRNL